MLPSKPENDVLVHLHAVTMLGHHMSDCTNMYIIFTQKRGQKPKWHQIQKIHCI